MGSYKNVLINFPKKNSYHFVFTLIKNVSYNA